MCSELASKSYFSSPFISTPGSLSLAALKMAFIMPLLLCITLTLLTAVVAKPAFSSDTGPVVSTKWHDNGDVTLRYSEVVRVGHGKKTKKVKRSETIPAAKVRALNRVAGKKVAEDDVVWMVRAFGGHYFHAGKNVDWDIPRRN